MVFSYISKAQAEIYLDNRKAHGINTILCYAAPFYIDRANAEGNLPFLNNNISTPNDAYFESVDWVINKAAEKDMQVIIDPCELANYTDSTKNYGLNVENARLFGEYMGNRYKNYRNIMWFVGGDSAPSDTQIQISNAMAEGIREYDINHIMSYHPNGGHSSSEFFNEQFWLKYNMVQSYNPNSLSPYILLLDDYNLVNPIRPSILIEPCYEDGGSNSTFHVRRAIAWSVFSGSFGVTYGNQIVYNFAVNTNLPYQYGRDLSSYWTPYLDRPALLHISNLVGLIKSRNWSMLVPDQDHEVITVGYGNYGDTTYATAEIASDGSFAMAFLPTQRAVTVDMTKFNGTKQLKWYDMTNNTFTNITTHSNTGTVVIPANTSFNSANGTDWILVIEDIVV